MGFYLVKSFRAMKPSATSTSVPAWVFYLADWTMVHKKNIQQDIERFILPLLSHLKRRSGKTNRRYIEAIENYLIKLNRDIIHPRWRLTSKEKEICYLVKSGLSTKEIADILCVSLRTIEHHRNHIRKKIGISKTSTDLYGFLIAL